jgi:tetratricopeptide (TPR) repeat protein
MKLISVAMVICLLVACAGVGIVATDDPLTKLTDAAVLFGLKNRPVPAERLILEAMIIYGNRNDAHGLGNAYREYADFLGSPAVARWEHQYSRHGFIDKSVSFDNRAAKASEYYAKALEYYDQAAPQLQSGGRYDALTNVYYNEARVHLALGQKEQACADFGRTLDTYNKNIEQNPSAKPVSPTGFSGVPEALSYERQRAGC